MRLCSYIPFCDQLCNPPEEKKAPAVPDPKEDLSDSLLKSHVKGANYSARRKEMLAAERKTQGVDAAKRADQEEAAANIKAAANLDSSGSRSGSPIQVSTDIHDAVNAVLQNPQKVSEAQTAIINRAKYGVQPDGKPKPKPTAGSKDGSADKNDYSGYEYECEPRSGSNPGLASLPSLRVANLVFDPRVVRRVR